MRRRTVLTGTASLTVPLAGCLDNLTGTGEKIGLVLWNYTSEPQALQVEILTPEESDTSEARVMRREFDVPPPAEDESAGVSREPDVASYGRYIVRVLLKSGRGEWDHHHFVPSTTEAVQIEIGIYRDDATGELFTRFF